MRFKNLIHSLIFIPFLTVTLWAFPVDAEQNIETTLEAYALVVEALWQQTEIAAKTVLLELVKTDTIAQELGFDSIKDAVPDFHEKLNPKNLPPKNIPFLVFDVSSESLRSSAINPINLPHFTSQIIFPLTVKGEPKSSVTLRVDNPKTGHVTRWGSRKLIVQLVKRRMEYPEKKGFLQSFLVRVPSLNRTYLGFIDGQATDQQLQLVPLFKDQYFNAGEISTAAAVFAKLSAETNVMSDAPR